MFVGVDFLGSKDAISTTPPLIDNITYISISNGIYDDLFGTDNADVKMSDESKTWDYDTRFHAKFRGDLFAGNVDYIASMVSSLRIKRRKNEEHTWTTIFEIPINENNDFNFELNDKYAQGNHDYYYSIVPVIEGIEGNINKNSIRSEFKDYFIMDKTISYPIIFNTGLSVELNKNISVVNTIGRKYPFVISNGLSQYKTGTLSFSLAPFDCNFNLEDGYNYRNQFEEWILNGEPKILKVWTGQIYMINVTSSIQIGYENHRLPSYQIQFTEIGDALNHSDMYNNNFLDVW